MESALLALGFTVRGMGASSLWRESCQSDTLLLHAPEGSHIELVPVQDRFQIRITVHHYGAMNVVICDVPKSAFKIV
jgi:hypothetical protein